MTSQEIVAKVWSFCHVLRDAGVSYGDYLEQLTYLIFLKMADEYSKPPYKRDIGIPDELGWDNLKKQRGAELEARYIKSLRELGQQQGMLGQIFTKAQNKIQDPAMLSRVIDMIDKESWAQMGSKVKGDIYEGILEKNAEDTKSGAGQYFTPRPLIKTIVECMNPEPGKVISDPACGTGGFLLAAYDFIVDRYKGKLDKTQKEFLKNGAFTGNEIVPNTRRLCLMNLLLHGIGAIDGEPPIHPDDALLSAPSDTVDYVLTNPPFGKKSTMTVTNNEGKQEKEDFVYNRQDFWVTTGNKQLNFVQHIRSMLKSTGKAAVVVPDNVLFEGGGGETVRKELLKTTNLHTILRLPTGIFYAHGVKANVIFFENKEASKKPWTKDIWFYDYRTNVHHTLKRKPLRYGDLLPFIECYKAQDKHNLEHTWAEYSNPEGRFRKYTYDEIMSRDKTSLDIFWLKDASLADLDNLPEPEVLAEEIVESIEASLVNFKNVLSAL
ncbi:class I SAM-dependent DNA methyltransferase [uncultured Pseudodesulfovibrio sp.]|uniref:class I SAM-dependent DNA methyltransferase n=1 Tax=uncultured Pseudodesulfovibrio sp. TaxID=2035858 RepID=UPI0029C7C7C6|nr:class I SAM-dependent DNA methyltransferase [uncultured Pseudodesulfovibrio sp.]